MSRDLSRFNVELIADAVQRDSCHAMYENVATGSSPYSANVLSYSGQRSSAGADNADNVASGAVTSTSTASATSAIVLGTIAITGTIISS